MIMSMYKKVCITNRKLVAGDYFSQIEKVAMSDVDLIIVREKDLSAAEYEALARRVVAICEKHQKLCVLHSFVDVAIRLQHPFIHLPMEAFRNLPEEKRLYFQIIGVSAHTLEEALEAQRLGAGYVTVSPIYATECKPGCAPKGLDFLHQIVQTVDIDVYALGGIHPAQIPACIEAGADGVCMMSEYAW